MGTKGRSAQKALLQHDTAIKDSEIIQMNGIEPNIKSRVEKIFGYAGRNKKNVELPQKKTTSVHAIRLKRAWGETGIKVNNPSL